MRGRTPYQYPGQRSQSVGTKLKAEEMNYDIVGTC